MLRTSLAVSVCAGAVAGAQAAQAPSDWPGWRGPHRTGVVASWSAPATWPARLTRKWEVVVGAGHSSPVVSGDRVVVHAREGEREVVRALDLQTGRQIWRDAYAAPYTMNPAARAHGPGPKSTPAIAGDRVATFGISGILSVYDLRKGTLLWRTGPPPAPPEYGTAMSPVFHDGLLIAHVGGSGGGALTAFDAGTGASRWRWSGDGPAYASPVIADIAGTTHVITQTERWVVGVNAANGQLLWQLPFRTSFDQNSVTPVVSGDVVILSGLEQGTTAVRVTRQGSRWTTAPVWKNDQVSMYLSSPVVVGSTLYGLSHRNRGQLFALDIPTGKTAWTTTGREGENASLIAAGPVLLVSTTGAELIVARQGTARFEEVKRYAIADSAVWAHPALAGIAILVKDVEKVICWSLSG
jgi:outer membrane protein assembly factor BamB